MVAEMFPTPSYWLLAAIVFGSDVDGGCLSSQGQRRAQGSVESSSSDTTAPPAFGRASWNSRDEGAAAVKSPPPAGTVCALTFVAAITGAPHELANPHGQVLVPLPETTSCETCTAPVVVPAVPFPSRIGAGLAHGRHVVGGLDRVVIHGAGDVEVGIFAAGIPAPGPGNRRRRS